MNKIKTQDRHQHQEPAELREDEKFDGCIEAVLMPPDRDEEVHRYEHQFPEEIKEEKIE